MRHYVGFHVGKGSHWACVLHREGEVILSRRVQAKEEALETASEVLRTNKERIDALEARLAELVEAHPKGKVVMSLPGMGTILTAEFLGEADDLSRLGSPDRFAAAAGIAPVLRASGKVSYRRRAKTAVAIRHFRAASPLCCSSFTSSLLVSAPSPLCD